MTVARRSRRSPDRRLTTPTFAIGGSVGLVIPTGDTLDLASGYFMYSYPAYFEAAGSASFETFIFGIHAGASFALNLKTGRFNAGISGDVCLAPGLKIKGVSLCVGGSVNVSSRGMVGCLIIIDDAFEPGVGYHWGDLTPHIFNGITDGCKPSRYWETNIQSARVAGGGARGRPVRTARRRWRRKQEDSIAFTVRRATRRRTSSSTARAERPRFRSRLPTETRSPRSPARCSTRTPFRSCSGRTTT